MNETRSTCCYCGVGCGVIIRHDDRQVLGVRGDPDHPANFGRLCTKGQSLHLTAAPHVQRQVRALQPMLRPDRGAALQPVDWDTALHTVADRLADVVRQHGPDAVGLYLSGQLLTEDYYVFNLLAKGLLGTNNVDTNSRLCMSSAVAGYKATLGADAPPACYDDLADAATVFITGSNMAWAHPVLFRRLEDARRANPAQKLIVADPRRTETAEVADLHLQLRPGTDVVLHHALLHVMLAEDLVDAGFIAAHTTGFDALRKAVRDITPVHAARVCGLRAEDIVTAARWFAGLDAAGGQRQPTLSLYCQGLNQSSSGTDKNTTLINLHLACGQIGRAGAGPLSLTGQPNAMGGREVGGLANLLPAHRDLANPAHRAEVAAFWGVPDVPARPGLDAVAMFEAAAEGKLQALWIVCTNPAHSMPDQALVRRALERCPLVIVQDAYATTATVAFADVLLPASSWAEKRGTVTNSERRISRVRASVPAPGAARDDWRMAVDVGRRLEARGLGRKRDGGSLFAFDDPADIWLAHRDTTRGRDLDITGLTLDRLDQGPVQWPCTEGATDGVARLYTDGRFATPDGRARFAAPAPRAVADGCDGDFPIALTTGRLRDQWHGSSRTGTLGRLFAHDPEPSIELHPQDLVKRGWADGTLLQVRSRRGGLVLPARASAGVAAGQAFVAMHWGPEAMAGQGVNVLMPSAFCPQSKQPELKHAAVQLSPADLPWRLVAAAWLPADEALAVREQLKALFDGFAYATCVLFGREELTPPADGAAAPPRLGLLWRAAAAVPDVAALARIEALLGLARGPAMRYADARAGQHRVVELDGQGRLRGFLLGGTAASAGWLLDLLQTDAAAAPLGRLLLADAAQPPIAQARRARQLCACHDVDEARACAALKAVPGDAKARIAIVQATLRCGTGCGSCLPALQSLARSAVAASAAAGEALAVS